MASKAAEKRGEAIKALGDKWIGRIEVVRVRPADLKELTDEIRALAPLGRTEKFKAAVENWAQMVEDETNPPSWALLQGQIWTAMAAGL